MQNLIIEKGFKTPSIEFLTTGILKIEGRSIPENPIEFYKEVFNWLYEYQNSNPKKTVLHIDLEYFNSSSGIILLKILKTLELISQPGFEVQVHWHTRCNDEETIETGRYYEKIVKIPFHFPELV